MRRLRFALIGLFALLGVAAAAPAAAQDTTFKVVAKDGRFTPSDLEVPANRPLRLEIVNDGTTPIEFESKALKQERVLKPGAKATVTIGPLKPGSYAFFDEFHPDTSKGKVVAK